MKNIHHYLKKKKKKKKKKKEKTGTCAVKLDMVKAYGGQSLHQVQWSYLCSIVIKLSSMRT